MSDKVERLSGFSQLKGDSRSLKDVVNSFKLDAESHGGTSCPCCGRYARVYKRKLNLGMILSLMEVYKTYRYHDAVGIDDYLHYKLFFNAIPEEFTHEFHKLLYWDLIEKKFDGVTPVKGFFRISLNGIKFVQREIGLPLYCRVYNNKVESHSLEKYVMIDDILKEGKYKYEDVVKYDFKYKKFIYPKKTDYETS